MGTNGEIYLPSTLHLLIFNGEMTLFLMITEGNTYADQSAQRTMKIYFQGK